MKASPILLLALALACRSKDRTDTAELIEETGTPAADVDGDGFSSDEDCDDEDAEINPGANELCDGLDNDCDGEVDEDAVDAPSWYPDSDGDGYGIDFPVSACEQPSGTASEAGDCDDADAAFYPGASEEDCSDPNDYNCDGSVGYADADGDGWAACEDCDDGEAEVHPEARETCDGIDNDCDSLSDDEDGDLDLLTAGTWYSDVDADGYGDPDSSSAACLQPEGAVSDSSDCDDANTAVNPGATELCNAIDDDCDGLVDEDDAADASTWYIDYDGDGYGSSRYTLTQCDQPSGYVSDSSDCEDADATSYPGGAEVCDGADNDCDGSVDNDASDASTWYDDSDGDGYGDASATTEACDQPTGTVSDDQDCDDGDSAVNPAATETCDSIDNDCDGDIDDDDSDVSGTSTWYDDGDSDGYGDASATTEACDAPSGAVSDDSDCDDGEAAVNPGATELRDGLDNDCDGAGYDGDWSPTSDTTLEGGTWEYTVFEIPSGVTVTATGSDPLEIYVLGDVDIAGSFDLSGAHGTDHGPFQSTPNAGGVGGGAGGGEGGDGGCLNCGTLAIDGGGDAPGLGGTSGLPGGGGGGGGADGAGDDGSDGVCSTSRCGSVYTVPGGAGGADLATGSPALQGGSGGGGGAVGVADNGDGGGGGGGGGAVTIIADSIDVSGSVDCSAGDGGSDSSGYDGGSGGGGSGGTIWLVAESLSVSGSLLCEGGLGGTTVIGSSTAQGGYGGDGADGFIWLDSDSLSVSGTTSPGYQEP